MFYLSVETQCYKCKCPVKAGLHHADNLLWPVIASCFSAEISYLCVAAFQRPVTSLNEALVGFKIKLPNLFA